MGEYVRRRRSISVAVVDSDDRFLRALKRTVHVSRDVEVEILPPGPGAFEYLEVHPADLVVADVLTVNDDGARLVRCARGSSTDISIVLATSLVTKPIAELADQLGFERLVEKPYSLDVLIADFVRASEVVTRLRNQLVESHLDVSRNIAGRFARRFRTLIAGDDLEALAHVGLVEAGNRFDPSRGEPFIAFAERRIRGAIIDEIRRVTATTRTGIATWHRLAEARRELERSGVEPTDEAVASALGLPIEVVMREQERRRVNLVALQVEPASPDAPPDLVAEHRELRHRVAIARQALTIVEQAIIALHYDEEIPLSTIASTFELSANRITQLHGRALKKLRRALAD
ncbi:MAG: sigma-70 family RNA polymerase sigma factor [Kofleriaceae bacterium]